MAKRNIILLLLLFVLGLGAAGCSQNESFTERQIENINHLLSASVTADQIEIMPLLPEAAHKFPAVARMGRIAAGEKNQYVFLVNPSGYRSTISTLVVIDGASDEVGGIKVLQQDETPGYGEWLAETWFTDRFKGKKVDQYLVRAVLEVEKDNEIIQITSATVTTQAVLNGVNSAMGAYREVVKKEKADPVSLKVEGFITEIP